MIAKYALKGGARNEAGQTIRVPQALDFWHADIVTEIRRLAISIFSGVFRGIRAWKAEFYPLKNAKSQKRIDLAAKETANAEFIRREGKAFRALLDEHGKLKADAKADEALLKRMDEHAKMEQDTDKLRDEIDGIEAEIDNKTDAYQLKKIQYWEVERLSYYGIALGVAAIVFGAPLWWKGQSQQQQDEVPAPPRLYEACKWTIWICAGIIVIAWSYPHYRVYSMLVQHETLSRESTRLVKGTLQAALESKFLTRESVREMKKKRDEQPNPVDANQFKEELASNVRWYKAIADNVPGAKPYYEQSKMWQEQSEENIEYARATLRIRAIAPYFLWGALAVAVMAFVVPRFRLDYHLPRLYRKVRGLAPSAPPR